MENNEKKNEIMLENAAKIIRLDVNNASFEVKNGFLALTVKENGDEKVYDRVFLHRAFPHDLLWEYISVTGAENKEIGLIHNIEDFDPESIELLKTEINRKYYSPVIAEINSVKERYGFSYWKIVADDGRHLTFTMQDTFGNIIRIGDDRAILVDVDGNRYVIPEYEKIEQKSRRLLEPYLY